MSKQKQQVSVTFDVKAVIKVALAIIILIASLRLLSQLSSILMIIATAFFLAVALNPVVSWLSRSLRLKGRKLSTGIAFLVVVGFLGLLLNIVIPPVIEQTTDFAKDLPTTVRDFQSQDNFVSRSIERYKLGDELTEAARNISSRASEGNFIIGAVNTFTSTVFNVFAILILTFMMLVEGPVWMKTLWRYTDKSKKKHRKRLLSEMNEVVTGYFNGQLLVSLFAALTALVVMLLLGVPNALAMAGVIAIFNLIPMFGVFISGAIVCFSTLLVDPNLALLMFVFFIVYQQVENATIQPIIHGKRSSLSPLIVFISALVGVSLAGIFGALVAIPVAGCIRILILDYLDKKDNENPSLA